MDLYSTHTFYVYNYLSTASNKYPTSISVRLAFIVWQCTRWSCAVTNIIGEIYEREHDHRLTRAHTQSKREIVESRIEFFLFFVFQSSGALSSSFLPACCLRRRSVFSLSCWNVAAFNAPLIPRLPIVIIHLRFFISSIDAKRLFLRAAVCASHRPTVASIRCACDGGDDVVDGRHWRQPTPYNQRSALPSINDTARTHHHH